MSEIGDCRLTISQADPQKVDSPDVNKLNFNDPFWLQIAVQRDSAKSKVLVTQGVEGQTAARPASTHYFYTKQVAENFASDLANLVRACGGTVEVNTAVLSDVLLGPR